MEYSQQVGVESKQTLKLDVITEWRCEKAIEKLLVSKIV